MANKDIKNQFRPPIVTVMGHIDHGKTSLLDKIRSTNVTKKESGGITQHIGAYQAEGITFIDTPGHAAFCSMRSRGASVTDIVVLVVAANDGIMAQTKECLETIKKAGLPFIVAINKIDLADSYPDKIKGQLVELGFTPEDYGGQTACIPVSAKTGQGIDKLLETIRLNAEIMELKLEPAVALDAIVIESKMDKRRGPVASVIVKKGTIKVCDQIFYDYGSCKVKALVDSFGKNIKEAGPSTPVEILGFGKVPSVGSIVSANPVKMQDRTPLPVKNIESSNTPKLTVVLKADVEGTLEALKGCLTDDVQIISSGVGQVTDNDVFMASASKAQIFAFNVSTQKFIQNLADSQKVKIFESKIIYEIIDNIQAQVLKMLDPTIEETVLGEGAIKAEFKIEKVRIAGVACTKGELTRGDLIHLKRDGEIIKNTKIEGVRQGKLEVEKVKSGIDCGMTFKPYVDFRLNDVIIAYKT